VILDWSGSYPDPEAYLSPLLSCKRAKGNICEEGEAVAGGTFWTAPGLQEALRRSDTLEGNPRLQELTSVDAIAAKGCSLHPGVVCGAKSLGSAPFEPSHF
jgi:peptide/nickel transport system substrate-binding protein